MFSALDSSSSGPGSSPALGHCGVQSGAGEFNAGGKPAIS